MIIPKETDDLEKQFDQSQVQMNSLVLKINLIIFYLFQIFLYEFEGRETVKRPHHCLPYAVVSLIQDGICVVFLNSFLKIKYLVLILGNQWPTNFDDLDTEPDILETDTLRVVALADDPLLQNKLKENVELAEAATLALEHIYEEEPPPLLPVVEEQPLSQSTDTETIPTTITSDNTSVPISNGTETAPSPTTSNDNLSATSPPPTTVVLINNPDASLNSTIPPPPPPQTSSIVTTAKTPTTAVVATIPLSHSASAVQAAYRQQTSLLGALPTASGLRTVPGGVYAASTGLANGLTGQILYGGKREVFI